MAQVDVSFFIFTFLVPGNIIEEGFPTVLGN